VADTGWSWAGVGQLTIPRFKALLRFWQQHPPVHRMVAAYMGIKPGDASAGTPIEGGPGPTSGNSGSAADPNSDEAFIQFYREMTGQMPP
jgi:hypothetical protein